MTTVIEATISDGKSRVEATIRHAVRLRAPTRSATGPSLPGVDKCYLARSTKGQIVDQPQQDAGQPQRLTTGQTDPLHRLLAVDRPCLHHHAGRRRGIAR